MASTAKCVMATFLTAVFLFSVLGAACMPANAAISARPTLKIESCTPEKAAVTVTPSSPGTASFTCTLVVTKPPAVGILVVSVSGTTSALPGASIVVSPMSIPFNTPASQQISVTVTIPQAAPVSTGKASITVTGTYPGASPTPATAEVPIQVTQYFRLSPRSEQAFVQFTPGAGTALQLDVDNRGNGMDSFSLEIVNLRELQKKNWIVATSRVTLENVPSDEFDTVKITVQSPKPPITYEWGTTLSIQVRLTSDNAKAMATEGTVPAAKDFVFTIYSKGFYIPGYEPMVVIFALIIVAAIIYKRQDDWDMEFKDNGK